MRIDDLFRKNLANDEVNVPDGLWERLETNLNTANTNQSSANQGSDMSFGSMVKSISTLGKTIIGITSVALAGTGAYFLFSETEPSSEQTALTKPTIEIKQEITPKIETTPDLQKTSTSIEETVSPIIDSFIAETRFIETKSDSLVPIIVSAPTTSQPITKEISKETPIAKKKESETPKAENKKQKEEIAAVISQTETFVQEEPKHKEIINIKIPNAMSPNGDGINDYFKIYNLESYPDNELVVLDRRGKIVYRCKNYQNDWSAEGIPDGVYYFRLLIKHPSNSKINQGTLTIIR
ncbi:MAG: gliding motility-associated C-terminal domain-containing protein [Bacteroidales bacterium]|nr:gliding motility-associated C-terminal domain-containing protein [Bacteroidales bacterium]MBO7228777.1 gliding motility-associated C-terminal domain-containing protein [Bacteroidales bacterium]